MQFEQTLFATDAYRSATSVAHDRCLFATAAMGTRFEIVIDACETADVRAVGEAAISEIERLHRLLSFYATDSLLSHINRTARRVAVRVDADTFALLQDAERVWVLSGGAFDVTRGTGMDAVVLDDTERTVRFTRAGVTIDLGGIAKGHAVDRAAAILRSHGVTSALVHGGTSSISTIGAPSEDVRGWLVAVAPSHSEKMHLRDETLSVSSASLRDHIIDPATGAFATNTRTAAVIGPSARLGDAWSTAAAVIGVRPAALSDEWRCTVTHTGPAVTS